jgi:hypothetical protein
LVVADYGIVECAWISKRKLTFLLALDLKYASLAPMLRMKCLKEIEEQLQHVINVLAWKDMICREKTFSLHLKAVPINIPRYRCMSWHTVSDSCEPSELRHV